MNVTPEREAPIIPMATSIQGAFLPARKNLLLSLFLLVKCEITISTTK
jgi:hypothetical protein